MTDFNKIHYGAVIELLILENVHPQQTNNLMAVCAWLSAGLALFVEPEKKLKRNHPQRIYA